jgi:hypothetical protein
VRAREGERLAATLAQASEELRQAIAATAVSEDNALAEACRAADRELCGLHDRIISGERLTPDEIENKLAAVEDGVTQALWATADPSDRQIIARFRARRTPPLRDAHGEGSLRRDGEEAGVGQVARKLWAAATQLVLPLTRTATPGRNRGQSTTPPCLRLADQSAPATGKYGLTRHPARVRMLEAKLCERLHWTTSYGQTACTA